MPSQCPRGCQLSTFRALPLQRLLLFVQHEARVGKETLPSSPSCLCARGQGWLDMFAPLAPDTSFLHAVTYPGRRLLWTASAKLPCCQDLYWIFHVMTLEDRRREAVGINIILAPSSSTEGPSSCAQPQSQPQLFVEPGMCSLRPGSDDGFPAALHLLFANSPFITPFFSYSIWGPLCPAKILISRV